jgi:hypothetical protein
LDPFSFMRKLVITFSILLGGVVIGLFSAFSALGSMGLKQVQNGNGWQEWRLGENERLLPYALGHFQAAGQVPPPKSSRFFVRSADENGSALYGDCVYVFSGQNIPARWWTISASNGSNPNVNAVLTAGQAVADADGQLIINISRHPEPGNWIAPPDSGAFVLNFVLSEPALPTDGSALPLPTLKKTGC